MLVVNGYVQVIDWAMNLSHPLVLCCLFPIERLHGGTLNSQTNHRQRKLNPLKACTRTLCNRPLAEGLVNVSLCSSLAIQDVTLAEC